MDQKILIFRLLLIFSLLIISFSSVQSQNSIIGKAKVIDGDTIHIENYKIRLHGIDAPEINQKCFINNQFWNCGIESSLFLKKLISNSLVHCIVNDIDKYERYIAECFANKINLNAYIVRNGWAIAYRYYSLDYVEEERLANLEKKGIWKGEFEEPYLFRKKKSN